MKKLLALLLILTQSAWAGLPPTTSQGQGDASPKTKFSFQVPHKQATDLGGVKTLFETGNKNLLANPSYEAATDSAWTLTKLTGSGTPSISADTSHFEDGLQSASMGVFNATAEFSQDTASSTQFNAMNMEASCWVKTTRSDTQLCAREAGADIAGTCQAAPSDGNWHQLVANFVGPSSGTMGVGVSNTVANTFVGGVNVDDCYVGTARNIGTVAQAQLWAQVKITGCASNWGTTTTSMSSFGAQTGCIYTFTPNLPGNCSAPSTNIPGLKCSSVPPGSFTLKYEGAAQSLFSTTGANAIFQFWDGTNVANELSYIQASSSGITGTAPGFQQTISYSSPQSNITWEARGEVSVSGSTAALFGQTSVPGVISVYYFPTQSQTVASLATVSANASYTSTQSATTTSTGSPADVSTSLSGSISPSGTPHNITCTADGTKLGWDCTLPKTGNYQVCYSGYVANSTVANTNSELTDGSNTVIVGLQQIAIATGTGTEGVGGCGGYTASSTTPTFKVRGYVSSGTGTFFPTSFSIQQTDSPGPQTYATGNMTVQGPGQYYNDTATFDCTSGTCSATAGDGFATIARVSAGNYTLTFVKAYTGTPGCTDSVNAISGNLAYQLMTNVSTTGLGFSTWNASSIGTDSKFTINCSGPH